MPTKSLKRTPLRASYAFWTLALLLVAAFLLGGSSRDDTASLLLLRPVSFVALAIGLYGFSRRDAARAPFLILGAILAVALVVLHLVPLPPALWMALPGRELAAEAARLGGSADAWRPLALVPWRAWNTLYALAAPFAALVLALQCSADQRRNLIWVILAMIGASMLLASVQVSSGSGYLYRFHSENVATGLFANRNHFAVMLGATLPMLGLVALRLTGGGKAGSIWLWLIAVAGAVALLMLLLTGSRSGTVLGVLALALLPLVYQPAWRGKVSATRRRYLILGAAALALLLLIAVAVYFSRAEAVDRLLATDSKDEVRFGVWGPIAHMAMQYFPVGSGVGSFVEVFQTGEPQDALRFTYLNHAHNDWLEVVLEYGVAGILMLLAGIAGWAVAAIRLVRAAPDRDGLVQAGRTGAIIILLLGLASLTDYPARVPSIACVAVIAAVWMALGARSIGSQPTRTMAWPSNGEMERKPGKTGPEEIR